MLRIFTKTLAISLTGLCLASTLALAQASRGGAGAVESTGTSSRMAAREIRPSQDTRYGYATDRAEVSDNAGWTASWNRVGSGGTNVELQSGMNPYVRDTEQPVGTNHPGADRGEWPH